MPTAYENQASSLSPVLWLKFDGSGVPTNHGSGGSTISLGNGTGATTGVSALSNTGYTFNLADASRYDISALPANTLSDKVYTIETVFRVLPGTTNNYQTIFRADNGNNSIILRVQGTNMGQAGKFEVYLCGNAGTGVNQYSQWRMDDGAFHHAVLLAYTTNWELYIDGYLHASGAYPAGTLNLDTAGSRFISNAPGETSNNLTIDEFAIYNFSFNLTNINNNLKALLPTKGNIAQIGNNSTKPVMYYSADESVNNTTLYNSGSSASSSPTQTVGNTLTKTASGGPGGTNGYFGTTALGVNNGVSSGSMNNFTFAFWLKRASAPASSLVLSPYYYYDSSNNIDPSSNTGWSINSSGQFVARMRFGGTTIVMTSTSSVCTNTWKHIAITRSGATYTLYINGVQEATTTGSASSSPSATIYYLYTDSTAVATSIDEYMLYPAAMTAANISTLYNAGLGAISINYTNTSGATASSLIVDPAVGIGVEYSQTKAEASADSVMPTVAIGINVDGGRVS